MTTKNKQIAFKNPFDLMQEQEEPMSTPTAPINRYQPPKRNVHAPLPFDPYEISQQATKKTVVKQMVAPSQPSVPVVVSHKAPSHKGPDSFASPFGNQDNPSPTLNTSGSRTQQQIPKQYVLDENGDIPLLDDIGIEPQKIKQRIRLVLKLGTPSYEIIHDPDVGGPAAIAGSFCLFLLLAGKLYFGQVYGTFITGTILLYILLNYMSQSQFVPLFNIMSILGYCLLPMLILGLLGVFLRLNSPIGVIVAILTAVWGSVAAGNFMDVLIRDTKNRKPLIVFPVFLFYMSFTLIVIF